MTSSINEKTIWNGAIKTALCSACVDIKKNFLWLFHGWAGRVYDMCVYYMTGTPEGSTESGFMEKPGIEPAIPGLQGIALIHYTTGAWHNGLLYHNPKMIKFMSRHLVWRSLITKHKIKAQTSFKLYA